MGREDKGHTFYRLFSSTFHPEINVFATVSQTKVHSKVSAVEGHWKGQSQRWARQMLVVTWYYQLVQLSEQTAPTGEGQGHAPGGRWG